MKKLFISQPMNGKTEEEIFKRRNEMIKEVQEKLNEEVSPIMTYIENTPNVQNVGLWCLGATLELLAEADICYFDKDWKNYRGCRIEHECAKEYGIEIIE